MRTLCFVLFSCVTGITSAQIETPPPAPPSDIPPPPPLWMRPLTWTPYSTPDGQFELRLVSDSITTAETLWHLGRTRFVSGEGVWPQTSVEHTRLFASLHRVSLDSLASFYWTPSMKRRFEVADVRDTVIADCEARSVLLRNRVHAGRWRVLMLRPDSATLFVLTAQVSRDDGPQDRIVDEYFGSLKRVKGSKGMVESWKSTGLVAGERLVNDTLGFAIDFPSKPTRRPSMSEGVVHVHAWEPDDVSRLPSVMVFATLIDGGSDHPGLTLDYLATGVVGQGFRRVGVAEVDQMPAIVLDKFDEYGDHWCCYVVDAPGNRFYTVMIRTEGHWGWAFAEEVISSMGITALR